MRQSLLSTFDNCALSTKLSLDHEQGWSTHPQGRGTIFHRFAAKALLAMEAAQEKTIPSDVALEILRECLRQHDVVPEDQVNIPFSQIKDLRWVVVKFSKDSLFEIETLASVEERLHAPIQYERPDGGMVERIVTGQLDALFLPERDHAVVIDWKDTWALPPPNELSMGGYFQQRIYAFLVFMRYRSVNTVTLREHYVRHKPGSGRDNTREATIERAALPDIMEEVAALVERFDRAVEHGSFDPDAEEVKPPVLWTPSPGKHCGFCPRPSACPIFPDAREQGAISSPEDAERFAAEAEVAKAALNQRMKALKAWADVRGPVPVKHAKDPHRKWGYKEETRTARPTRDQLEAAMAVGDVDLDNLYVERTQTKFKQHHAPPIPDEPDDAGLMSALEESMKQVEGKRSSTPDDDLPF